eukprot:5098280-Prymnesium_polylepis.1
MPLHAPVRCDNASRPAGPAVPQSTDGKIVEIALIMIVLHGLNVEEDDFCRARRQACDSAILAASVL